MCRGRKAWRELLRVLAMNGRSRGGNILHDGAAMMPPFNERYLLEDTHSEVQRWMPPPPFSPDNHLDREAVAASNPLQLLPDHLLDLIIGQVESSADVGALSRTCSALYFKLHSPAVVADWLWQWKGDHGLFLAAKRMPLVLKQLVEVHHANINARDSDGCSLLLAAAEQRFDPMFSALVYLLAAPGIDAKNGLSPTGLTCRPAAHWLLRLRVGRFLNRMYSYNFESLHGLALHEHSALVIRELQLHPDIDVSRVSVGGGTPLRTACARGVDALVLELLKDPTIVVDAADVEGRTALQLASRGGHLKCGGLKSIKLLQRFPGLNGAPFRFATRPESQQVAAASCGVAAEVREDEEEGHRRMHGQDLGPVVDRN